MNTIITFLFLISQEVTLVMLFTEKQLKAFSRLPDDGRREKIVRTHEYLKKVLSDNLLVKDIKERYGLDNFNYEVYLQGSYANRTNVESSSDVDLVVELTTEYAYDIARLDEGQRTFFKKARRKSRFTTKLFRTEVLKALTSEFKERVSQQNSCLKLSASGSYVEADIVPCFSFRKYSQYLSSSQQNYTGGIQFTAQNSSMVVNYPKIHIEKLNNKSKRTNGKCKEMVRLFKNVRGWLEVQRGMPKNIAKSYYLENLLFNVPDRCFTFNGSYQELTKNIIEWLLALKEAQIKGIKCANGEERLFAEHNWNYNSARQFFSHLKGVL